MLQRLFYGLLIAGIAVFFVGARPAFAGNGHHRGHHKHHYRHGHHHSPKHYSHHRHSGGYYRAPVYQHHGYSRHGYYRHHRPDYGVRIILPLPPLPHIVFGPYYR